MLDLSSAQVKQIKCASPQPIHQSSQLLDSHSFQSKQYDLSSNQSNLCRCFLSIQPNDVFFALTCSQLLYSDSPQSNQCNFSSNHPNLSDLSSQSNQMMYSSPQPVSQLLYSDSPQSNQCDFSSNHPNLSHLSSQYNQIKCTSPQSNQRDVPSNKLNLSYLSSHSSEPVRSFELQCSYSSGIFKSTPIQSGVFFPEYISDLCPIKKCDDITTEKNVIGTQPSYFLSKISCSR